MEREPGPSTGQQATLSLTDNSPWATSVILDRDLTVKESCEPYIFYLSQQVGQGHRDLSDLK